MTNSEYPLKSEQELRIANLRLKFTNDYETHIRPLFVSKTRSFLNRGLKNFEESHLNGAFEFRFSNIQTILTNIIFDNDKSLFEFVNNKMSDELDNHVRQVLEGEFTLLRENGYTCENGLHCKIM